MNFPISMTPRQTPAKSLAWISPIIAIVLTIATGFVLFAALGQRSREIDRGRRFAHAALLVGEGDDFAHTNSLLSKADCFTGIYYSIVRMACKAIRANFHGCFT